MVRSAIRTRTRSSISCTVARESPPSAHGRVSRSRPTTASSSPASNASYSTVAGGRAPHPQAGTPKRSRRGGEVDDVVRPEFTVGAHRRGIGTGPGGPGRRPGRFDRSPVAVGEGGGRHPGVERVLVPPAGEHQPHVPSSLGWRSSKPSKPSASSTAPARLAKRRASSSPEPSRTVMALIFTTVMARSLPGPAPGPNQGSRSGVDGCHTHVITVV